MRLASLLTLFLLGTVCKAQLTVTVMVPPAGMMDKQQLWNMVLSNTDPQPLNVQLQLSFADKANGQPVFTATVMPFVVNPGTQQVSVSTFSNVHYNILNGDYQLDASPNGLLPVGTFIVCYDFLINKSNKVVQECQTVSIPPLSPLLLSFPSNGSELQEFYPAFSWLAPSPVNSLTSLRYELQLVEVMPNQSPADAIQENISLFETKNVLPTNFLYQQNAPSLQAGRQYAWRVKAMSNRSEISRSDVWSFTIKKETVAQSQFKPDPVFVKLKKAGTQDGSTIFWGNLRLDYFNATADTAWNIEVQDLSSGNQQVFIMKPDSLKLKRGPNLIDYPASEDRRFIDKHQYLLRIVNSRNEVWQLRFEYRKQD